MDVSGDGENNDGIGPAEVYAAYPFDGVTVNALVIGGATRPLDPDWNDDRLLAWFGAEVLRGPGAFTVLAERYNDYARAMELKLERELTVLLARPKVTLPHTDSVRGVTILAGMMDQSQSD